MSSHTRLVLCTAALVLLACGVWFGLTPKAVHIAECGSPFFPADRTSMIHEKAYECQYALGKRYTVLWVVFLTGAALGLAAALGGVLARGPREERSAR